MHDIIIIGAGPAGLTAALYALRAGKTALILEKSNFGGQMTYSPKIENFPGTAQISGNELAEQLIDQVISHGADIEPEEVTGIEDLGGTKKSHNDERKPRGESRHHRRRRKTQADGSRRRGKIPRRGHIVLRRLRRRLLFRQGGCRHRRRKQRPSGGCPPLRKM